MVNFHLNAHIKGLLLLHKNIIFKNHINKAQHKNIISQFDTFCNNIMCYNVNNIFSTTLNRFVIS